MKERLNTSNAQFAKTVQQWHRNADKTVKPITDVSTDDYKDFCIVDYVEGLPKLISYQDGYSAYRHISFDPEVRAYQEISSFRNRMIEIRDELAIKFGVQGLEEFETVNTKAVELYSAYLRSKSNTASTMITGGSNFNVRQNNKRMSAADNAYDRYKTFIDKAIKAVTKKLTPKVTPEDELTKCTNKLATLENNQLMMKGANKILRSKKSDVEKLEELLAMGWKEKNANILMTEKSYNGKLGFESYQLTNNNARIKATRERIAALETKSIANTYYLLESDALTVQVNYELDRVMLFFDGKPSDEVRTLIKRSAFKWSPRNEAWQRKITDNCIGATKRLIPSLTTMLEIA